MKLKTSVYAALAAFLGFCLFAVPSDSGSLSVGSSADSLTLVSNQTFNDDVLLQFGSGGTVHCLYETADANANALLCAAPEGGATDVPVFIWGDASAENVDLGLFNGITAPSIAILSDDQVSAIRLYHDQTNAVIDTTEGSIVLADSLELGSAGVRLSGDGDGAITLLGLGNGSDEDLTLNLDDTSDVGTFTSSTALATLNFSSIALQESGIAVLNNDEIDASSELLAIMDDETGTGVLTFATLPTFTTGIIITATDPADAGEIRLNNAATIAWEADPAGADTTLTVDTSEIMQASGTFNAAVLTEGAVGVPNTGDKLSVFAATTSTELAGVLSDETGSGTFVMTSACISVHSTEHNPTEAGATNDFVSLNMMGLSGSAFSATETDQDTFMVPVAMVARNLRVEVDVAPGVGNDAWIVTLRDDAASTILTCTIDEAATSCSDTTNAPAIVAGSKLDILVDSSGAGADPDAAAVMNIAFCLGQ